MPTPDFKAQVHGRLQRLVLTLIAKKYVAWVASWLTLTVFAWHGKVDGTTAYAAWLTFTAAVFYIDVRQKQIGLDPTMRGIDDH
jgi:hypothetical protein